jgi:UDP-4-amino-4,6-dideoxy-N-acetyl-beta-L-altrosamine N-acetyltransferase
VTSLRDIQIEDRDKILEWRNLPIVADYMYTDHVITPEEHHGWFSRILKDPAYKYWMIVCDGEEVGLANLYAIDRQNKRCSWAFYVVSPNVRGKGVGSYVEYTVLNYVFQELNLQKLCCEVLAFNRGVVEMHRRFGFSQEGLFRKHIFKRNEYHDVVSLAMLKEDWETLRPQQEQKLRSKGVL